MSDRSFSEWQEVLFDASVPFENKAVDVFRYQFENQPVYRRFCESIGVHEPGSAIPLIPIEVFRDVMVKAAGGRPPEAVFQSSGTTGTLRSRHEIADLSLYHRSCYLGFSTWYPPDTSVLMAYLPG
ncbi:hypothetical protein QLX67_14025, partial [Balneolaceae bacterium ANBcel3]|nr:hypothetical protein [Balneolaceae bacterium ANBcel3]